MKFSVPPPCLIFALSTPAASADARARGPGSVLAGQDSAWRRARGRAARWRAYLIASAARANVCLAIRISWLIDEARRPPIPSTYQQGVSSGAAAGYGLEEARTIADRLKWQCRRRWVKTGTTRAGAEDKDDHHDA